MKIINSRIRSCLFMLVAAAGSASNFPKALAQEMGEQQKSEIRVQMLEFKNVALKLFEFAFLPSNDFKLEKGLKNPEAALPPKEAEQKRAEILQLLQKLNSNVGVAKHQGLFKDNPVAEISFGILAQSVSESLAYFEKDRIELSRDLLKASFQTCLTCHSSGLTRQKFNFGDTTDLALKLKSPLSKARMYFTFREFDKVEKEADFVFGHPKTYAKAHESNPRDEAELGLGEQRDLLKLYLASVLLQESKPRIVASKLADFQTSIPKTSPLSADISEWIAVLKSWASETDQDKKALSKIATLKLAQKWVGLEKGENLLIGDRNLIPHLRAKETLTRLAFSKGLSNGDRTKILRLLGLIYQAHDNTLFLGMGETYFVSCIKSNKHTAGAEACYRSLAASIEQSSTGSSGVHIAPEDEAALKKLHNDAFRTGRKVR